MRISYDRHTTPCSTVVKVIIAPAHDGSRADGQVPGGPASRLPPDGRAGGERGSALGILSQHDRYIRSEAAHGGIVSSDRQNADPRRDGVEIFARPAVHLSKERARLCLEFLAHV